MNTTTYTIGDGFDQVLECKVWGFDEAMSFGTAFALTWTPELRAKRAELMEVCKDLVYWIAKPIENDQDRKGLIEFNRTVDRIRGELYAIELKTGHISALHAYERSIDRIRFGHE